MDHLAQPQDPLPFPGFPIFGEAGYDHGDFFSYPSRCGLDMVLLERHELGTVFKNMTSDEIGTFLQNWLVFGLLELFLGVRLDAAVFIKQDNDGNRILTTAKLPEFITQWATDMCSLPRRVRTPRLGELGNSVRRIQNLHNHICSEQGDLYSTYKNVQLIPETLLLCISLLGTTLAYAISHLRFPRSPGYETSDEAILYKNPGWWNIPRLHEYFEGRGWCPNDFVRLGNLVFATGFMYTARLKRSETVSHSKCTQTRCTANDIVPTVPYECKHVRNRCDCSHIGVSDKSVMHILEAGQFPVLELSKSEDGSPRLTAVPYTDALRFVAISHVWSDGLGNPYANTIPTCRAIWFYNVLCHVYPFETGEVGTASELSIPWRYEGRSFYFWLDTLCVPVDSVSKEHRALAIRSMARTYSSAHVVLVLDSELLEYECMTSSPHENLFRVLCSAWMRRVWTLHEAVLGKRLLVLFGDTFFDIDEAVSELRSHTLASSALDPLTNEACRFYVQIRAISHAYTPVKFSLAWSAMQTRQTSVMDDEVICFANMLRIDTTEILNLARGDTTSREAAVKRQSYAMKRFFGLLDEVPFALLWHLGPKLLEDGYRWAPSNFHGGVPIPVVHRSARRDNGGLYISAAGLLLHGPWADPDINSTGVYEIIDSKYHFELVSNNLWHQLKSWDKDGRHQRSIAEDFDSTAQLALILDDNTGTFINTPRAILVSITKRDGEIVECRYERLVRVRYAGCCANQPKRGSKNQELCEAHGQTVHDSEQDMFQRTAQWTPPDQQWHVA